MLTTTWFKKHWRSQMSIGARHTACHQFSQIFAVQRWLSRHDNELTAETLEDIRTRLEVAATEASEQRTIDDARSDIAQSSLAPTQPEGPDTAVTTPPPVRRRLPARKGSANSLDSQPELALLTQAASAAVTEQASGSVRAHDAASAASASSTAHGLGSGGSQVVPHATDTVARTLSFDDTAPTHTQRTVHDLPTSILVQLRDQTTERLCSAIMSDGATR
eukprot:6492649-Amphidinium_carterae.4